MKNDTIELIERAIPRLRDLMGYYVGMDHGDAPEIAQLIIEMDALILEHRVDDLIDKLKFLENMQTLTREFYGIDQENKPNEYCVWSDRDGGWIETDAHLRERIKNRGNVVFMKDKITGNVKPAGKD